MLKKQFRLKKQRDFENVFQKGAYFSENFLALKVVENNLKTSRFGFMVSKKISKKAVVRNRIKRLLRESVRLMQIEVKSGFDMVFISRSGIVKKSLKEISGTVKKLLKKSGLLI